MRWCSPLLQAIATCGPGGYIVTFPAYRPDLAEELARATGFAFVDFRKDRMAPLGLQAHTLDLTAIDAHAASAANRTGIVLHNAEALLATRAPDVRRAWLAAFVAAPRNDLAILPLALFGADIGEHPRVVRLAPQDLPEETMLRQLASMRFQ
jgi:hypothetical protein